MLKKKSGDRWVALSVIACSAVLFIALALGLSGQTFVRDSRQLRVRFPDVTGITVSSRVKYAGAPAGTVAAIRMLNAAERKETAPNLVEVTLHLHPDVPPLPKDARISIAADTLLSDKFVLITGGSPAGPAAGTGDVLQGLAPTTFDQLARDADEAINGLRHIVAGGNPAGARDLVDRLQKILNAAESAFSGIPPVVRNADGVMADARAAIADVRTVLAEAGTAVADARAAASDARSMFSENKARVAHAMEKLDSTAAAVESLAKRSESILRGNESRLNRTLDDFRITAKNLRVTSAYSSFLLRDLAERPSSLIWGGSKKKKVPSEAEILGSSKP